MSSQKKKKSYYFGGLQVIKINLDNEKNFNLSYKDSKEMNLFAGYDDSGLFDSGGSHGADEFYSAQDQANDSSQDSGS